MFAQKLLATIGLAASLLLGTELESSAHPRRAPIVVTAPAPVYRAPVVVMAPAPVYRAPVSRRRVVVVAAPLPAPHHGHGHRHHGRCW